MNPRARIADLEVVEQNGGLLVHDRRTSTETELHPLAALVWKNADGATSVESLSATATEQFGHVIEPEQVWAAVDSLAQAGLLEGRVAPPAGAQRVGRRLLLRHVATGSVAAAALGAFAVRPAEAAPAAEQGQKLAAEERQKAGALAQEERAKLVSRREEEHEKVSLEREGKHSSNRERRNKNAAGGSELPLGDGWSHYGRGYQTAAFTQSGDIVTLGGVVAGDRGAGPLVAVLPAGARPQAAHIFSTYSRAAGGESPARVEVLPDGEVAVIGQPAAGLVLSLSGISFLAESTPHFSDDAPAHQERLSKASGEEEAKVSAVERDQKSSSAENNSKLHAEQDQKLQVAERNSKASEEHEKLRAPGEENVKLRQAEQKVKVDARRQEQNDKVQARQEEQENKAQARQEELAKQQLRQQEQNDKLHAEQQAKAAARQQEQNDKLSLRKQEQNDKLQVRAEEKLKQAIQ